MSTNAESGRHRYLRVELPNHGFAESWLEARAREVTQETKYTTNPSRNGGGGGDGSGSGRWRRCEVAGCLGETIAGSEQCFAHLDSKTRFHLLHGENSPGPFLGLRGVQIDQVLWDSILNSRLLQPEKIGFPIYCDGAEISANMRISNKTLLGKLTFSGARIYQHLEFRGCRLSSGLQANHASFDRAAINSFQCSFGNDVSISYSRVKDTTASFAECGFDGAFFADGFSGSIALDRTRIRNAVSLRSAIGTVSLSHAVVDGPFDLDDAELESFNAVGIQAKSISRLTAARVGHLDLSESVFDSRLRIAADSIRVSLERASLTSGGLVEIGSTEGALARPEIALEQIRLGGPLRVAGKPGTELLPEVLTLRNADAGNLTFSRVHLGRCHFYGAHDLQKIGLESTVEFARAPFWAARRRYIADELAWRKQTRRHGSGWTLEGQYVAASPRPRKAGDPRHTHIVPLEAAQVAATYRELRCGFEAKSDMAGAADFYYGEMEMRRWSKTRGSGERFLVFAYWLLAGYGLRARRALAFWLAAVFAGAYFMGSYGFVDGNHSIDDSLMFAFRATIPGVKTDGMLTPTGLFTEALLRIVGPLSLALFAVAVRTRLMRKPSEA